MGVWGWNPHGDKGVSGVLDVSSACAYRARVGYVSRPLITLFALEVYRMSPLRRGGLNKRASAKAFRKHSRRTKGANMARVMRGGIRF